MNQYKDDLIDKVAGILCNLRIMSNGSPPFSNPLDIVPDSVLQSLRSEADYVLKELSDICLCPKSIQTGWTEFDDKALCNLCGKLQMGEALS